MPSRSPTADRSRGHNHQTTGQTKLEIENRRAVTPTPSNGYQQTSFVNLPLPPWTRIADLEVFAELPGISGRADPAETKLDAAISRIRVLQGRYIIYTDGSATGGTSEGGAAAVITTGDPTRPTVRTGQ